MVDYFHTHACRMRFIADLLDDPAAGDCGICDNCTGAHERTSLCRSSSSPLPSSSFATDRS